MEAMPIAEDARGAPEGGHTIHIDHRARMEILFAILLGLFLSALDQTIVGTALPTIATDLHGNSLYIWVVTIYLLTSTISGPVYGKLSDQFGRKRLLMFGISVFLIGSALSGLSQSMEQLIVFRGIQGLGAGAIFPISLAVIGDLFSPQERGKYQGLFGAVFGISALIGPALGGFLTDQVSWHWIFFVNIPIGAVALYIIGRLLPAHVKTGVTQKVDYVGVSVFTLALVPILIGLTNAQFHDWTDPWVGGLIAVGLLIGIVFLFVERRAKEPIVPLDLFKIRTYWISILGHLPGQLRVLRSDHLPAALVSDRGWFIGDGIGLPAPAAPGRTDPRLDTERPVRQSHGPLQVADSDCPVHCHRWPLPDDEPARGHADADPVYLAVHRRSRHRPNVGCLHDHRPERRAVAEARGGDKQPDLLPSSRRNGRLGHRRNSIRADTRDSGTDPGRQRR